MNIKTKKVKHRAKAVLKVNTNMNWENTVVHLLNKIKPAVYPAMNRSTIHVFDATLENIQWV
tara:strand:- start:78 stop:263 length:186 start_codon:yes stop_codon:yes gene_type:complete